MKALIEAMDRYDAANNDGHINYSVVIQRIEGSTEVTIYSNFDEAGELVVAYGSCTRLSECDNGSTERAIIGCLQQLEAKYGK